MNNPHRRDAPHTTESTTQDLQRVTNEDAIQMMVRNLHTAGDVLRFVRDVTYHAHQRIADKMHSEGVAVALILEAVKGELYGGHDD